MNPRRYSLKALTRFGHSPAPHAPSQTLDGSHSPVQGHEFPLDPLIGSMALPLARRAPRRTTSKRNRARSVDGAARGGISTRRGRAVGKVCWRRRRLVLRRDRRQGSEERVDEPYVGFRVRGRRRRIRSVRTLLAQLARLGSSRLAQYGTEHRLYRLALPRLAAACTESLTPFLSLLPCASYAGLSSLLNPHRLFDGEWTLIDIGLKRTRDQIDVALGIGSVLDPVRSDRLQGQLGRRGAFPATHSSVVAHRSCY